MIKCVFLVALFLNNVMGHSHRRYGQKRMWTPWNDDPDVLYKRTTHNLPDPRVLVSGFFAPRPARGINFDDLSELIGNPWLSEEE